MSTVHCTKNILANNLAVLKVEFSYSLNFPAFRGWVLKLSYVSCVGKRYTSREWAVSLSYSLRWDTNGHVERIFPFSDRRHSISSKPFEILAWCISFFFWYPLGGLLEEILFARSSSYFVQFLRKCVHQSYETFSLVFLRDFLRCRWPLSWIHLMSN